MSRKRRRGKRRLWPVIVFLLIALLIAGGLWYLERTGKLKIPGISAKESEDTDGRVIPSNVKTEFVKRGSIRTTAQGSGSVEPASTRAVTLEYDGVLEEIGIEPGDTVAAGDVLATYDTESIDDEIDAKKLELDETDNTIAQLSRGGSDTISAPVAGRVKRIFAQHGDVASEITDEKGGLLELSADGRMKTEVVTLREDLTEGSEVTVEFGDHSASGVVWSAERDEETGERHLTVTWQDDTSYRVDENARVLDPHGDLVGEGITASAHPYLVRASTGVIDSVEVSLDSNVSQGDTLFTRTASPYNRTYLDLLEKRSDLLEEMEELEKYRENPVVTSPADGYIATLDAVEGMAYLKDQQLCTIADALSMNLKVDIDELDIDGVRIGQSVEVSFDAFEGDIYTGEVSKISGVGENIGGVTTYAVTISLADSSRIRDAMSATATITLEEKTDVLLIPADAVEGSEGAFFAEVVKDDGSLEKREITIGLVNEDLAEVTGGLSEGEEVVVNTRDSEDLFQEMMERRSNMMQSMENN